MFDLPDDPIDRLWIQRNWDELIPLILRRLTAARREPDPGREAQCLQSLSFLWQETSQPTEAVRAARRAVLIRRRLGDPEPLADALASLGDALANAGREQEALRSRMEALELYRRLGDTFEVCLRLQALGDQHRDRGRWEEAREAYAEALPLVPPECPWPHRVPILKSLARIQRALGDLPAAILNLTQGLREQWAVTGTAAEDLLDLAELHLHAGLDWEGRECLREARCAFIAQGRAGEAGDPGGLVHRLDSRSPRSRWRLHDPAARMARA